MKFRFTLLVLIASSTALLGQVGINNTDPKATLDITSSNIATPSNTDGLLIPRVDEFPVIDPTIEQDGMMVFATGNGAPMKGFYFWNHGTTAWEEIAPASSNANWYEVGSTNVADDINDDIYTLGSLSLGVNAASPSAQIYMQSNSDDENFNVYSTFTGANASTITSLYSTSTLSGTGGFEGVRNDMGGSNSGTIYALRNQFSNTGTGQKIGLQNNFASLPGTHKGVVNAFTAGTGISMGIENVSPGAFTIDGALYGVRNSLESLGNGQRYGVQTIINSTGSGTKYGEHIVINTVAGGQHYGIYSDVQKPSGYSGYFVGRTSFGTDPSSNRYRLPETDGSLGQVMTTNGAGQLSFSTPSTGAEKIDDLTDAKSDNDGTDDGSSIFLGVSAGAGDDSTDNRNVGIGYEALMTNTNVGLNVAVGYQALRTANTANNRSTAIGYQSMMANTIGADNVALGLWSLLSNTDGDYNTSIGARSLISHTNGNRNTVIGYEAGESLTTGDGNILIGYQAADNATVLNDKLFIESSGGVIPLIYGEFDNDILQINGELQIGDPSSTGYAFPTNDGTTGQVLTTDGTGQISFITPATGAQSIDDLQDGKSDNDGTDDGSSVFLGLNAGQNDDSSNNQNVGMGFNVLSANTTGVGNSAFGYTALQNNTASSFHTAIGYQALSTINGGSGNVGVGYRSLFSSSSSSDNVGMGTRALEQTTSGGDNVGIGSLALANNTVGIRNVSLGRNALEDNVSGNNNVAIGYNAGSSNTGSSNLFLGNESGANQTSTNNKLFIENTDADENSALLYGDFGTDSSTSGNILRTNSQFQIGNPSNTGFAFPTIDGVAGQVMTTNGAGTISFQTITGDGDTQNTLDEAYDEGGAGLGRNITADNGAVTIAGQDGLTVTGTINNGDLIAVAGAGTRMFFNPRTGSFRAGTVNGTQWDSANLGNNSIAFGTNNIASGGASTALGTGNTSSGTASTTLGSGNTSSGGHSVTLNQNNTTSGLNSFAQGFGNTSSANASSAMGLNNSAPSWAEITVGANATTYAATDATSWVGTDRIFTVGNGVGPTLRSNALTVYKSGEVNINDAYNMPVNDGTANQVLTTDGAGTTSWQDVSTPNLSLARITMSTNQSDTGPAWTKLNFDTVDFDLNTDFNATTDAFVAPSTGYYRVGAQWRDSNDTTSSLYAIGIYVNGSRTRAKGYNHTSSGTLIRSINSVIPLNANDTVEIYYYHSSTITVGFNDFGTYFEIEQIR